MATFNDFMNLALVDGSEQFQHGRKLVLSFWMFLIRASSLTCNTNSLTYRIITYVGCLLGKLKRKVLKASIRKSPF